MMHASTDSLQICAYALLYTIPSTWKIFVIVLIFNIAMVNAGSSESTLNSHNMDIEQNDFKATDFLMH